MTYQCFQCDREVMPGGRFCHHCGAPTYSADQALEAAARASAAARARIKQDVHAAAQVPHSTLMLQTVLLPQMPKARPEPLVPPRWKRVAKARLWRRWYFWVPVGVFAAALALLLVVDEVQDTARQQDGVHQIVTRLGSKCFGDSRAQLEGYVARIHAASGGADSLLDSAALFEYVVRGVTLPQGDCSKVAELLSRPDRFEQLFRQASSR